MMAQKPGPVGQSYPAYPGQYGVVYSHVAPATPATPAASLPQALPHYMTAVRMLSILLLLFGVMSCVTGGLGIATVDYAGEVAVWPTRSGSGIWCGLTAIIAGILGIISSCITFNRTNGLLCVYAVHCFFVAITASLAGTSLNYSIKIWVDWTLDLQIWYCVGDYPHVVAMAAMNVTMSVVLLMTLLLLFIGFWLNLCILNRMKRTSDAVVVTTQQGLVVQQPPPGNM